MTNIAKRGKNRPNQWQKRIKWSILSRNARFRVLLWLEEGERGVRVCVVMLSNQFVKKIYHYY
jgi:hypothetical protein